MKTMIFFYTGTGNSLWTARLLARGIGESEIIPIGGASDDDMSGHNREIIMCGAEAVGFVFPVHIWGVPRRVVQFIGSLIMDTAGYYFAVAVNGGQVASTLLQLRKLLERKGAKLSAGYEIPMPSNYIPWGGPGPEDRIRERCAAAERKISEIASIVRSRGRGPVEKGPLWQNIIFSPAYRLTFRRVPGMDRSFWTDPKCNGCGICEKVCSCGNIRMEGERPVWLHRCEQCLACIQWCPQEAVQFGKRTPRYPRYHHPEVSLKDIISLARTAREGRK